MGGSGRRGQKGGHRGGRRPALRPRCLQIVPADESPIRKRVLEQIAAARREFERLEREIERFERVDRPAYISWVHREFGPLLTDLRQLEEEHGRKLTELEILERELAEGGGTPNAAYRRIETLRRNGMEPDWMRRDREMAERDFPFPGEAPDGADGLGDLDDGIAPEDLEDPAFAAFFEEMTADFDEFLHATEGLPRGAFYDEMMGQLQTGEKARRERKEQANSAREVFCRIAKALHPDLNGTMDQWRAQLWFEAQEAHRRRDVPGLELIWQRVMHGGTSIPTSAPVSLLIELAERDEIAAEDLRDRILMSRRDPAWNFTRKRSLTKLRASESRLIQETIERIRQGIDAISAALKRFTKRRTRSRRRDTANPRQQELPF